MKLQGFQGHGGLCVVPYQRVVEDADPYNALLLQTCRDTRPRVSVIPIDALSLRRSEATVAIRNPHGNGFFGPPMAALRMTHTAFGRGRRPAKAPLCKGGCHLPILGK